MSAAPFFKLNARSAASSIEPRKRTGEAMNFAMAAAPAAFDCVLPPPACAQPALVRAKAFAPGRAVISGRADICRRI